MKGRQIGWGRRADRTGKTDWVSQVSRAERAGQSIRQQGHDGQADAGDRFIVVGQRASHGTEGGTLPLPGQLIPAALLLIPAALLLIPEAMDPGPLRERADQLLVDRRRGRGDCDSVHQASETFIRPQKPQQPGL